MTISYPGGFRLAAVLLDASGSIIRVAIDGWEDAAQFMLVKGQWLSESREAVEIDSRSDTSPQAMGFMVGPRATFSARPHRQHRLAQAD